MLHAAGDEGELSLIPRSLLCLSTRLKVGDAIGDGFFHRPLMDGDGEDDEAFENGCLRGQSMVGWDGGSTLGGVGRGGGWGAVIGPGDRA
jgi:hypothetical protein